MLQGKGPNCPFGSRAAQIRRLAPFRGGIHRALLAALSEHLLLYNFSPNYFFHFVHVILLHSNHLHYEKKSWNG